MTDETTNEETVETTDSEEPTEALAPESSDTPQEEAPEEETSEEDDTDDETETEPLSLTPEDLKLIKADPKLRTLYHNMNKGLTMRLQKTSSQMKEAEHALQMVEALRRDPQGTIAQLSQALNVPGSQKAPDEDVHQQMNELFGPEVGAKVATAVQRLIDERTSGLKQKVESTVQGIQSSAGVEATKAFRDSHPDLDEVVAHDKEGAPITVEQQMLKLMSEYDVKGTVDSYDYLSRFYKMAKAEVDSKVQTARVAAKLGAKLEKGASVSKTPGSPAAAKVALAFPTGKGAFAKAAAMALRGERAG